MRRVSSTAVIPAILSLLVGACTGDTIGLDTPTPTDTPTATSASTPTATSGSTPTATSASTPTMTAIATPTATKTATATATSTPTASATTTATATQTPTKAPTPTAAPTPAPTAVPTPFPPNEGDLVEGYPVVLERGGVDEGHDVIVDAQGDVWVSGEASGYMALWKFNQAGQVYGGFPIVDTVPSEGRKLFEGPEGDIWVAGSRYGDTNHFNFTIWRYDVAGNSVEGFPVMRRDRASNCHGYSVWVTDEAVWASGSVDSGGQIDFALYKYDKQGVVAEGFPKIRANDAGNYNNQDWGEHLFVDGDGNVWVSGSSYNGSGSSHAFAMTVWGFDSSGEIIEGFPAVSSGGYRYGANIERVGDYLWVFGSANGSTGYDVTAWKYDLQGGLAEGYPIRYDQSIGGYTSQFTGDMAIDHEGNMWVVGYMSQNANSVYLALWQFSPDGQLVGEAPQAVEVAGANYGLGIAVDASGGLWVTGYSKGADSDVGMWRFR